MEGSAADYVIGGNGGSLAYLLANNSYDVWLGNARGNIFSQDHETLNKTSHDFWKFSFHEIGVYDVAAMIDFALNKLNKTKLSYIGYSQGTAVLFVLLSIKPEFNSKISTVYLRLQWHICVTRCHMQGLWLRWWIKLRYESFVTNGVRVCDICCCYFVKIITNVFRAVQSV